ncbi:trehalose-6-phosphate synthase [Lampropedia cohaerens]|uniref:Trehalose-6-phosphate synthase n=1 Tax=Lampropedia cohaerens TaxID=1610491 RepID=A0A0U1PYV2_9BURK|nr:trehalose-6-phosphate synthase [Lampropedia cohaerens]KKW67656.1 trehalose-6-phosphate synthase [Lampropedia cohaerens]
MKRLIIVSNRVAPPQPGRAAPGGLVSGVLDALRNVGGIWFGWNGEVDDAAAPLGQASPQLHPLAGQGADITLATVPLSRQDYEDYYCGFANGVLWPSFHYRSDLARYDPCAYAGYLRVNRALARALRPLLRDGDVLWVHDYHLIPFAQACRELGVTNRIGFFLHIPFPAAQVVETIPPHRELLRMLRGYDLLGFQTERDRLACIDYLYQQREAQPLSPYLLAFGGRLVRTGVYPISVDVAQIQAMAQQSRHHLLDAAARASGRQAILSVDRLDYSKGLPERFRAYEHLLEQRPDYRRKVQFIQIAPPSRGDVATYRRIREQLDASAGRINGRFSELDWLPLRYLTKGYERSALMGLYRQARVGLVTPLRDGMNLVAKEYVAAQNPDDPGVLVLSQFAGAAVELEAALLVNPYDHAATAAALARALDMPLAQRRERHQHMLQVLQHNSQTQWCRHFLRDLAPVQLRQPLVIPASQMLH